MIAKRGERIGVSMEAAMALRDQHDWESEIAAARNPNLTYPVSHSPYLSFNFYEIFSVLHKL
jgi:hypothetical protein